MTFVTNTFSNKYIQQQTRLNHNHHYGRNWNDHLPESAAAATLCSGTKEGLRKHDWDCENTRKNENMRKFSRFSRCSCTFAININNVREGRGCFMLRYTQGVFWGVKRRKPQCLHWKAERSQKSQISGVIFNVTPSKVWRH